METIGPMCDYTDLIVQALDNSVSQAPSDVGDDVIEMFSDGAPNPNEGGETASARPAQPTFELLLNHVRLMKV